MKKFTLLLLFLFVCSRAEALWNFFPDNIIMKDSGTTIEGTGKILDFGDNIDVTYDSTTTTYHVTGDSSGVLTDLTDVNSSTQTAGNLLISNGYGFNSVALSGDASLTGDGTITLTGLFEIDIGGDLQPTAAGVAGNNFELDGNDDIQPKS